MFGWFRVVGDSMRPALSDGDRLLTARLPGILLRKGMLAVVSTSAGAIVKRIERLDAASVTLSSDNQGTESAYCGVPLNRDRLIGVVLWKLARRSRRSM